MTGPIRYLLRLFLVHRHRSKTLTRAVSLEKIQTVTVLMPPSEADSKVIASYFESKGIRARVLQPTEKDRNFIGCFKKNIRSTRKNPRHEDLYLSLVCDEADFAAYYDACCSDAVFKLGCCNYKDSLFNITINIPEGKAVKTLDIFATMANCLEKVV